MDNKIKLLDINLSSIVCAAAAKLEKSTATTNSGPHTYTQECVRVCVCVCVLPATRRAQCALCAPLSASNNDNGLESIPSEHTHRPYGSWTIDRSNYQLGPDSWPA